MITSQHEFETIPAFEVIAGSSLGGWSTRECCVSVLTALDSIVGFSETFTQWIELAKYPDDGDEIEFLLDEIIEYWNDNVDTMPDYCSLQWHDNELIILPDVDSAIDELPSIDGIPDAPFRDGTNCVHYSILHVNDHGNIDYCYWDESKREYVIAWSVV